MFVFYCTLEAFNWEFNYFLCQFWHVNIKACISPLPENGYGANLTKWPARVQTSPDRLQSIKQLLSNPEKSFLRPNQNIGMDMNVVPVSGPNTLPVIYDHGLIGVMHD
ncbi:putative methyltransferase PMT3 [Trifolium repens]|jgi:hypothetical protein|nr:putative methyltransferase PMT3 [Trifolium repens]